MKRRIAIIVLLLIGGAVVNIAVAWGCSLPNEFDSAGVVMLDPPIGRIDGVTAWRRTGSVVTFAMIEARRALRRPQYSEWHESTLPVNVRANESAVPYTRASGLPLHSMYMYHSRERMHSAIAWGGDGQRFSLKGAQETITFTVPEFTLPLRPLWPGFMINTIFYALLLWMLIIAPFATRRMLRRRRGQCEKCAYPIGVSAVCTECGAAVRPLVARSS